MKGRSIAFVLLALALPLLPVAAAAETPPQNLHLVGDHWTAWNPPTEFPPGVEVYTIVRGDTLWTLAATTLGDPYLWPQLWEQNRYILDAHWIYPGDPLVIGLEITTPEIAPGGPLLGEETGAGGAATAKPSTPWISAAKAAGQPVPLGAESDIYCSGYIGELEEPFPFSLIGSEYGALAANLDFETGAYRGLFGTDTVKVGLDTGDVVYLDGGYDGGMRPGQLFTVVQPEERVRHPVSREVVGRFYRYLGRVRVLSVQAESAIGEVVLSCDPVMVGALLQPFTPEPVPLGRRSRVRPVNLPSPAEALAGAPVILRAEDNVVTLGEDNLVYIDRGEDSDLVPGDVMTIYRMHREGLPPVILGELAVLSIRSRSAVARILHSRYTIHIGDRLELK